MADELDSQYSTNFPVHIHEDDRKFKCQPETPSRSSSHPIVQEQEIDQATLSDSNSVTRPVPLDENQSKLQHIPFDSTIDPTLLATGSFGGSNAFGSIIIIIISHLKILLFSIYLLLLLLLKIL